MKKLIVKCLAFLLIIGGLTASFLISKPKYEVKADTPSLYYFDVDTSHDNYITIILYLRDTNQNLVGNTCDFWVNGYDIPSYNLNTRNNGTAHFLRYNQLDHDDWDAYIFNFNYPSYTNFMPLTIVVVTSSLEGENTHIGYNITYPFYPTFKTYYDQGEEAGYSNGVNDRNAYWQEYIQETYESSTGNGYQRIFEDGRQAGFSQGQDSLNTMEWFETTADGVSSILQLKLLPSITIGALIFIPLMFFILKGVLWIWRRN